MSARSSSLFAAVCLLWGVPYLFIEVALRHGQGPLTIVAGRVALGAVVLLPVLLRAGALRPLRSRWRQLGALAVIEVMMPFPLIAVGQQTVSSAVTGVLIATEPLFVLLWARWLGGVPPPGRVGWAGLLVGFAGVLVLLGVAGAGAGVPLVLTAAALYGLGALLVSRWFAGVPHLSVVAGMLLVATPALLLLAAAVEPAPALSGPGLVAVVVLGVACTAGGFAAFFALIAAVGSARAALITYVAPVVSVAAGVVVLGETITARTVAGVVLILTGAALAARIPRPAEQAPAPAAGS